MKHTTENSVEKGGMLFMIMVPSFKLLSVFVNWWVVWECVIA